MVRHFYFPYDMPIALRAWLGHVRPRLLLMMETEIGVATAGEIADLLRATATMELVDDNDRNVLLQTASAIESIPQVLDQAVNLLNAVMMAHEESTRFFTAKPMIPFSVRTISLSVSFRDMTTSRAPRICLSWG